MCVCACKQAHECVHMCLLLHFSSQKAHSFCAADKTYSKITPCEHHSRHPPWLCRHLVQIRWLRGKHSLLVCMGKLEFAHGCTHFTAEGAAPPRSRHTAADISVGTARKRMPCTTASSSSDRPLRRRAMANYFSATSLRCPDPNCDDPTDRRGDATREVRPILYTR